MTRGMELLSRLNGQLDALVRRAPRLAPKKGPLCKKVRVLARGLCSSSVHPTYMPRTVGNQKTSFALA